MRIDRFFSDEYTVFSAYDNYRKIASYIDGFKPSARKIFYTIRNEPKKVKIETLANKTAESTEYLHGAGSLMGVAVNMAQDFAGTNNIPILTREGQFGNRLTHSASAPRYIYSKLEDICHQIFDKKDDIILIQQELEGKKIEPRWYIPIIPMILINGSEGMGVGYAQKIFSRKVSDVIEAVEDILKGKEPKNILPNFNGFDGEIVKTGDVKYDIKGIFSFKKNVITITELTPNMDLDTYRSILSELKKNKVISKFIDKSEDNSFLFEVTVDKTFTDGKTDIKILEQLKLIQRISENFTCNDANNKVVVFENEIDLLKAFVAFRLSQYETRKQFRIDDLKKMLIQLSNKAIFINAVVDEKIKIYKKSKQEVESQINAYTKLQQPIIMNSLLNIPIYHFTLDKVEELNKEISKVQAEYDELINKDIKVLWKEELKILKKYFS